MLLYDISSACSDPSMSFIVLITKKALKLIHIIGPILCIIGLAIIFTKLINNPEDKKLVKNIRNSLLALAIVFFIPLIVQAVMRLLDNKFELSRCWNFADEVVYPKNPTYIEIDARKAKKIYSSPENYEKGNSNNSSSFGKGLGPVQSISIQYNVKDSLGRCGKGGGDHCSEVATVKYRDRTVKYYMGCQNNSGLLGGSCRAHAFTCAMNAVNDSYYSTLDLQNYMKTIDGNGVFKGRLKYDSAIDYFKVNARAYFEETSISESYELAKAALANGQPVMIFVGHEKCSDLAGTQHALLLLGYDNSGNVIFIDSVSKYPHARKRNLEDLILGCMSQDGIAKEWMRMVIFSF